jgi:aldose 1-epimerase
MNLKKQDTDYKCAPSAIELDRRHFQKLIDGKIVDLYTILNKNGLTIKVTNFGAKIQQILVPDSKNVFADIALGFDSIDSVINGQPSMGAFIGRYANRISNARFDLEGKTYSLGANSGVNNLHGGSNGSRFKVFSARQISPNTMEFSYVFNEADDHFPGNLSVTVLYSINDENELEIEWTSFVQEKTTVVSFTSHTYFNLEGKLSSSNSDYQITINADRYLPIDKDLIPTGEISYVQGTPFDFRKPKRLGDDMVSKLEQIRHGNGYDHYFVLNEPSLVGELNFAARVAEPHSGRVMEVWTTEPGVQLFSGNNLTSNIPLDKGKGGGLFMHRCAICLEPSRFPDSPNKTNFPDTSLKPGDFYNGKIVYKFGVISN